RWRERLRNPPHVFEQHFGFSEGTRAIGHWFRSRVVRRRNSRIERMAAFISRRCALAQVLPRVVRKTATRENAATREEVHAEREGKKTMSHEPTLPAPLLGIHWSIVAPLLVTGESGRLAASHRSEIHREKDKKKEAEEEPVCHFASLPPSFELLAS